MCFLELIKKDNLLIWWVLTLCKPHFQLIFHQLLKYNKMPTSTSSQSIYTNSYKIISLLENCVMSWFQHSMLVSNKSCYRTLIRGKLYVFFQLLKISEQNEINSYHQDYHFLGCFTIWHSRTSPCILQLSALTLLKYVVCACVYFSSKLCLWYTTKAKECG